MFSDYHMHTSFSGDCDAPVRHQIEQAILLGMEEICITDHHDFDVESGDIDFQLDVPSYFETLIPLREEYKQKIRIRIGVELGLQPHLRDYLRNFVSKYPFDFVIGSTHFVGGLDPFYPQFFEGRTEREAYEDYFGAILQNIQTCDDFDVIGHIDYIVRYGPHKNLFYNYKSFKELLDPILKAAIERGRGIECNTSGYNSGLGQPNPSAEVLERFCQLGGEIVTVGSDAHTSQNVGAHFHKAKALLERCGFRYYATFENRAPAFHKI